MTDNNTNNNVNLGISQFANHIGHPIFTYLNQAETYQTKAQNKDVISFLSTDGTVYGEDRLQMPKEGYQVLRKHAKVEGNHGYTLSSGTVKARQAIVKLYQTQFPVPPSNVFINHGGHMGLLSVLQAFTNPDDEILVPEIGYPIFTDLCPAFKVKAIPYRIKKQQNFQIDLEHVQTLISQKTQFLFVVNPANPTGTIFSQAHMKQILQFLDQNQLPLVVDEIYLRQNFPDQYYKSFGDITTDVPVISISGVEKTMSVPGWCTSWTVVFDKHGYLQQIVKNLAVLCTIFLHTNRITQQALPELLDTVGLFTHDRMQIIKENHDYVIQSLKKNEDKISPEIIKPISAQGTIYIALEIINFDLLKDIKNDKEFLKLFYEEQNVKLLPLSVFGGQKLQGIRLLTLVKKELYDGFIQRLAEFIQNHKK